LRLLLFSGGIDSTAIASMERPDLLFFVDYGQLAAAGELRAARAISAVLEVPLDVHCADLSSFGAGAMVGGKVVSPTAPEFWPFRNQMLVTLAVMAHADREPLEILIGTVAGDQVHPDGTQAFVTSMNTLLESQGDYRLRAPAIGLSAEGLMARARLPREILGWTFSCHTGEWACGQCRGCSKHDELKLAYGL
jgi:7-cyano-7-deazaguanine synthase